MSALERPACVGEQHGWVPRHLAAFDNEQRLVGAVPLYLKDNSYGEFVFDWSWADAYQRYGVPYYPKSVVAVPYTIEPNDIVVHAVQHQPADAFRTRCIDQFDQLYAESAENARVMAISIHPYLSGVPHRIRTFEAILGALR